MKSIKFKIPQDMSDPGFDIPSYMKKVGHDKGVQEERKRCLAWCEYHRRAWQKSYSPDADDAIIDLSLSIRAGNWPEIPQKEPAGH